MVTQRTMTWRFSVTTRSLSSTVASSPSSASASTSAAAAATFAQKTPGLVTKKKKKSTSSNSDSRCVIDDDNCHKDIIKNNNKSLSLLFRRSCQLIHAHSRHKLRDHKTLLAMRQNKFRRGGSDDTATPTPTFFPLFTSGGYTGSSGNNNVDQVLAEIKYRKVPPSIATKLVQRMDIPSSHPHPANASSSAAVPKGDGDNNASSSSVTLISTSNRDPYGHRGYFWSDWRHQHQQQTSTTLTSTSTSSTPPPPESAGDPSSSSACAGNSETSSSLLTFGLVDVRGGRGPGESVDAAQVAPNNTLRLVAEAQEAQSTGTDQTHQQDESGEGTMEEVEKESSSFSHTNTSSSASSSISSDTNLLGGMQGGKNVRQILGSLARDGGQVETQVRQQEEEKNNEQEKGGGAAKIEEEMEEVNTMRSMAMIVGRALRCQQQTNNQTETSSLGEVSGKVESSSSSPSSSPPSATDDECSSFFYSAAGGDGDSDNNNANHHKHYSAIAASEQRAVTVADDSLGYCGVGGAFRGVGAVWGSVATSSSSFSSSSLHGRGHTHVVSSVSNVGTARGFGLHFVTKADDVVDVDVDIKALTQDHTALLPDERHRMVRAGGTCEGGSGVSGGSGSGSGGSAAAATTSTQQPGEGEQQHQTQLTNQQQSNQSHKWESNFYNTASGANDGLGSGGGAGGVVGGVEERRGIRTGSKNATTGGTTYAVGGGNGYNKSNYYNQSASTWHMGSRSHTAHGNSFTRRMMLPGLKVYDQPPPPPKKKNDADLDNVDQEENSNHQDPEGNDSRSRSTNADEDVDKIDNKNTKYLSYEDNIAQEKLIHTEMFNLLAVPPPKSKQPKSEGEDENNHQSQPQQPEGAEARESEQEEPQQHKSNSSGDDDDQQDTTATTPSNFLQRKLDVLRNLRNRPWVSPRMPGLMPPIGAIPATVLPRYSTTSPMLIDVSRSFGFLLYKKRPETQGLIVNSPHVTVWGSSHSRNSRNNNSNSASWRHTTASRSPSPVSSSSGSGSSNSISNSVAKEQKEVNNSKSILRDETVLMLSSESLYHRTPSREEGGTDYIPSHVGGIHPRGLLHYLKEHYADYYRRLVVPQPQPQQVVQQSQSASASASGSTESSLALDDRGDSSSSSSSVSAPSNSSSSSSSSSTNNSSSSSNSSSNSSSSSNSWLFPSCTGASLVDNAVYCGAPGDITLALVNLVNHSNSSDSSNSSEGGGGDDIVGDSTSRTSTSSSTTSMAVLPGPLFPQCHSKNTNNNHRSSSFSSSSSNRQMLRMDSSRDTSSSSSLKATSAPSFISGYHEDYVKDSEVRCGVPFPLLLLLRYVQLVESLDLLGGSGRAHVDAHSEEDHIASLAQFLLQQQQQPSQPHSQSVYHPLKNAAATAAAPSIMLLQCDLDDVAFFRGAIDRFVVSISSCSPSSQKKKDEEGEDRIVEEEEEEVKRQMFDVLSSTTKIQQTEEKGERWIELVCDFFVFASTLLKPE